MKAYSCLKHTYTGTKFAYTWHSSSVCIALFAALTVFMAASAFGSTPQLSRVSCSANSYNAAGTDSCLAHLSARTTGQVTVSLSSNDPAVTVPGSVNVPPHRSSVGFIATVSAVPSARTATITATAAGVSKTFSIQLTPSASTAPTLSAFSCSSSSMTGPGSITCTPTLSGAAPNGGVTVSVSSSSSTVAAPNAVTVQAGATSAPFTASVSSFSSAQTVTLSASAGGVSKTFALQLTPATPTLSVNATNISFGNVTVNSQATQTVTLTSSGTASVTVNAAAVTGTGFTVSGSGFPVTLNPGQTLNLSVQFAPTAAGAATGQLKITSNSSTNSSALVALTATGQAQAYAVDLSWNSPTDLSDPVVGYNIYRTPSGASSYAQINSSQNPPTAFTDATVISGQAYDYIVKSVDAAGTESAPSNSTTVAIP